jgi:hypothetical protein
MTIARLGRWLIILGVALVACTTPAPNATEDFGFAVLDTILDLATFQEAAVVIGQPDFAGNLLNRGGSAAADTLASPLGNPFVTGDGVLFVPDFSNNRVLGFDAVPTANDAEADFVLGQPDVTSNAAGTSATTFTSPASVFSDGTRLAVVDTNNHRVLIWNSVPTTTQVPADVVVGQTDTVSNAIGCSTSELQNPTGVALVDGKLIVVGNGNHRILIWDSVPSSNGAPADVVLGQSGFTTCAPNDDDQNGADDGAPSARTLSFPFDVWSDGTRLVVSDSGNHRVLIWNTFPTSDFAPADLVLGQGDFTTADFDTDARSLNIPRGVLVTSNDQLLIADTGNNRVLVFDSFPIVSDQAANRVLGQSNFTNAAPNDDDQDGVTDGTASARSSSSPSGLLQVDGELLVTEQTNHRLLIFESR